MLVYQRVSTSVPPHRLLALESSIPPPTLGLRPTPPQPVQPLVQLQLPAALGPVRQLARRIGMEDCLQQTLWRIPWVGSKTRQNSTKRVYLYIYIQYVIAHLFVKLQDVLFKLSHLREIKWEHRQSWPSWPIGCSEESVGLWMSVWKQGTFGSTG